MSALNALLASMRELGDARACTRAAATAHGHAGRTLFLARSDEQRAEARYQRALLAYERATLGVTVGYCPECDSVSCATHHG